DALDKFVTKSSNWLARTTKGGKSAAGSARKAVRVVDGSRVESGGRKLDASAMLGGVGLQGRVRLSGPRWLGTTMTTALTRRSFIARGGTALAALSFPALAAARRAAPKTVAIYRLDPGSERCGGGVGSCKACVSHAGGSLFPTPKAAAGNR